jgi:hypothetical protein
MITWAMRRTIRWAAMARIPCSGSSGPGSASQLAPSASAARQPFSLHRLGREAGGRQCPPPYINHRRELVVSPGAVRALVADWMVRALLLLTPPVTWRSALRRPWLAFRARRGCQDQDIVPGLKFGVPCDVDELAASHDEADPGVAREAGQVVDGAAAGR